MNYSIFDTMRKIKVTLIVILLVLSQKVSSQYSIDIYPYNQVFKTFNNEHKLDSIFSKLKFNNNNKENLILIKIAYANAIDQLGNHTKSIALMKNLSTDLNSYHPIIQSEYYQTLGNISIRSQNPELALTHYNYSIKLLEKEENIPVEILQSKYIGLGTCYNALEDNQNAMNVFNKALSMEISGVNRNSLYLKLNIALTNSKIGNLTEAKTYFIEALHYIRLINDSYAEIRTLGNIADIYVQEDSIEKAKDFYLEGKKIAIDEGYILDLIRFENALSKLFFLEKNYYQAYKHLIASDSISNKYNTSEVSEKIVALEMQYQIQEEKLQKETKEKLLLDEKNKNIILFLFVSILSFFLFIVIWLLVISKRKNMILLQQNIEGLKHQKNSTHNVKNNLYSELIEKVEFEMEENKVYSDSKLTLDFLAKKMQTNRSYLSEAINNYYELSFSQWINEKRIFHAKEMLVSSDFDQYSIEGISSMVGFSSISAFNSNFKKITGLTPSFFRLYREK